MPNPVLATIPGSLIRALNAQKRPGDIDLGLGEPVLKPAMAPFERALAWVQAHGCPYSANAGLLGLREAIAAHYAYPGLDAADNVCVTVGSQEALFLAIKALCDPATDEVLIVTPAYPAYAKICQMEGVATVEVGLDPLKGFAPDAARVLEALTPRTRLLLLATPSNPTGRVWPASELRLLAQGLTNREGPPVTVLIDEVYRELAYGDAPHADMAALYPHTVVTNSLSKSNALTGLRLGWLLAPQSAMADIVKAHQFVATAASTFSQQVALALFETPGALAAHRPHYMAKRGRMLAGLAAHGLGHVPPDGAFYCMVALPPSLAHDSVAAAYALLDSQRVVTVPGAAFGAEGWLRLSWVADDTLLDEGLRRIAAYFKGVGS